MNYLLILILLSIDLFYAWRYYKLDIDPDYAMFVLGGTVGSKYGKDFLDCKSPGVHLFLSLLGKITGGKVDKIRLLHYLITGAPSIIYFLITNDFAGALAFMVLVHSGWLFTFHGNVGDLPAGFIFLALVITNPWLIVILLALATLYEPKLIVMTGFMILVNITKLWIPLLFVIGIGIIEAVYIWYNHRDTWNNLIMSNWTIPKRMNKARKGLYPWMPYYTSNVTLYMLMWLVPAIYFKPDLIYWIPAILFLLISILGKVIRPNHLIPLVAWIAAANIPIWYVVTLVSIDWISAGFYFGNIWARFYEGLSSLIKDSRIVGDWMKDKEGSLWVNAINTEIYVWANKAPTLGMTEQIEIAEAATERRVYFYEKMRKTPPLWIVCRSDQELEVGRIRKYDKITKSIFFDVYKRKEK